MPDNATSTDAAVQLQLDRLWALSPGADVLGLERITRLLARLGDPHRALPPVFHVAGTNGKGSTCAFLRAAIEAAGKTCHVYTSPHLVRFNERIRLAGELIDDAALAALLCEVLDQANDIGASFFEVTTAAAFLAFARTPADACIVEVGLGGRLDATNILPEPAACGIAALGVDHQAFLGDTLLEIAAEKAGIAKPGVRLVTMDYPETIRARIAAIAEAAGTEVVARGEAWNISISGAGCTYTEPGFRLTVDRPAMAGPHQADNYGLAIAMLRHQQAVSIPLEALHSASANARWPARFQRLGRGPLTARITPNASIWVDGAHNPSAALPVAETWSGMTGDSPAALIVGMLANKDADGVLAAFCGLPGLTVVAVPVPGHEHHVPEALAESARRRGAQAWAAASLEDALDHVGATAARSVLIAGSLYLAGDALMLNREPPE